MTQKSKSNYTKKDLKIAKKTKNSRVYGKIKQKLVG